LQAKRERLFSSYGYAFEMYACFELDVQTFLR
jgi:hypothetical protein